jgi:hypothetical protein
MLCIGCSFLISRGGNQAVDFMLVRIIVALADGVMFYAYILWGHITLFM